MYGKKLTIVREKFFSSEKFYFIHTHRKITKRIVFGQFHFISFTLFDIKLYLMSVAVLFTLIAINGHIFFIDVVSSCNGTTSIGGTNI